MKYVIFTHTKTGIRLPVLMPETILTHSQASLGADWVATSAGFFDLSEAHAYGKSDSLKLEVKEMDKAILVATTLGLDSTLMLYQDTDAALLTLKGFCKCGHSFAAHKLNEGCGIHGCACEGFERCI